MPAVCMCVRLSSLSLSLGSASGVWRYSCTLRPTYYLTSPLGDRRLSDPPCYVVIIIYHPHTHTMIHETVTSATD